MKTVVMHVVLSVFVILSPVFCSAQVSVPSDAAVAKLPPVISATLSNGMRVLVLERKYSPTISFSVMFKVGNVDMPAGKTGLAHMFEHMIFKGTKKIGTSNYKAEKVFMDQLDGVAAQINREMDKGVLADQAKISALKNSLEEIQKKADAYVVRNELSAIYDGLGAEGLNAWTSADYTMYFVSLPSNRLESWMIVESDRFKNPVFREFYRERDVVLEEMHMSDAKPNTSLYKKFLATAFTAHPYRNPVLGWESDLQRLTRPDAEALFKSYYSPENAVVAIVGDVDPAKVIGLMKKYFEPIPAVSPLRNAITAEPEQKGEKRVSVNFDASPQLLIGYKQPGINSPDYPTLVMISEILGTGRTSRFYKNILEGKQLAVAVDASVGMPGEREPSLFYVSAVPLAPHTCAELEQALYAEIEKLKTGPVTDWEIQKVLNQYNKSLISRMESNDGMSNVLAYGQGIYGDWRYDWQFMEKLKKVTAEDIAKAAAKYLVPGERTVGWIESTGAKAD